ncbi:MAG TPA: glycosyltransferase family 4 protein [Cytophagaceae bacterium]|jgi:glycosyltransferase involved in cell wall biosynthesis|nr:glycosyltransferase family 4 protein [Cytophagaceae bacterium]
MTKQLKIVQITNRIPFPLNDGGNLATYNITKYLHQFGHNVILASLNTKKHYQNPIVLSTIATVYSTDINTQITLPGLLKSLFQKTPYNINRFVSSEFENLLEQIIKKHQPDIIQFEGIYLSIYASKIKKYSSAPLLLRSHNIEHEIWERTAQHEKNLIKRWYLKKLSKKIKKFESDNIPLFKAIVAITDRDAAFYKNNKFQGKLKTIPAGVDLESYHYIKKSNDYLSLCFLGSMEWMPNVQAIEWYIEKVWPTLIQKFPRLTLHIAGKGMSEEMKNRKIPGITFHGTVPDAGAFINEHDVMIVPLLSGGGMRLKIIEAMAIGCCVLSTTIGAEGIEAKENHEILLADSPEEFILKIESIISQKIQLKNISINAMNLVREKYTWEKLVREIEKFYLELT